MDAQILQMTNVGKAPPKVERLILVAVGALFIAAFFKYYSLSIVPRHEYIGITTRFVDEACWVIAWTLSLLPLAWLPIRFRVPSDAGVWVLYLTVVAPGPGVALMVSGRPPFEVLGFQSVIVFSFFVLELRHVRWPFKDAACANNAAFVNLGIPLIVMLLSAVAFAQNGFRLNLSFSDVYIRRLDAREAIQGGTFVAYANALLIKAFVPIALAVGVTYKRRLHLLAGFLGCLAVFSVDGTKIAMLTPILLTGVICLTARPRLRPGVALLALGTIVVGLAWLEESQVGSFVLNDFAVRRTFVTPSLISTYYWEYYLDHPHVYLQDGVVGSLLFGDREYAVGGVIGLEYFDSEDANANAGIWATAFAHFGAKMLPVVSLLAAIVFHIVDRLSLARCFFTGTAIAFMLAMVWSEKAFHTSLLSGGVAPIIAIFYLFPKLDAAAPNPVAAAAYR